jgi:hypothetical protein
MSVVRDDGPMHNTSPAGPRSGGPKPQRSFTPAKKLVSLAAYEFAIARLRRQLESTDQRLVTTEVALEIPEAHRPRYLHPHGRRAGRSSLGDSEPEAAGDRTACGRGGVLANRPSPAERDEILVVVNSPEFVPMPTGERRWRAKPSPCCRRIWISPGNTPASTRVTMPPSGGLVHDPEIRSCVRWNASPHRMIRKSSPCQVRPG